MRIDPRALSMLLTLTAGLVFSSACSPYVPGNTGGNNYLSGADPDEPKHGDSDFIGGDVSALACSPSVPEGWCPRLPDGKPAVCVAGVCRSTDLVEPCAPDEPEGYCPPGDLCVEGACEPESQDNACAPAKPEGACPYGALCFDGVCYPVREEERCGSEDPAGICPPGQHCDGGECFTFSEDERCRPVNPGGHCDAWERCLAGECTAPTPPDACGAERPTGRCPVGEACVAGGCEGITDQNACSPERPSGLCPWDTYCAGGHCLPLTGPDAPCGPSNPGGVCPPVLGCGGGDCSQTCIGGVCVPEREVVQCDLAHPRGYCPPGEVCVEGSCEIPNESDRCSAANPTGVCGFGSLCVDGVCYPVGEEDLCSVTRPDGICPAGQHCDAGVCAETPESDLCSPTNPIGLCDAWEQCVVGVCTAPEIPDECSAERPSGRCPTGEACVAGSCVLIDDETACGPQHPAGLCPWETICVDGYCVPPVEPEAPCSPVNPGGTCPLPPGCTAESCREICAAGVCLPDGEVDDCGAAHPAGYCPAGMVCVEGWCEEPSATNLCSPVNPEGSCDYGSLCFDGVCYPVRDDELCSSTNPTGICLPDQYCNGGVCLELPVDDRCSPTNPDGHCDAWQQCTNGECTTPEPPDTCAPERPHGRCPTGEACVDGVCEPVTIENACGPENPSGLCPRDYECAAGYCEPVTGTHAPCGPDNPEGICPAGQGCTASGCQQITPDNVCSWWNTNGLCPPGLECHPYWGECILIHADEACGPEHPDGPCVSGDTCVAGECVLIPCNAEFPDGTCPNGLACHGGECLFPSCGPLVPYSGICPPGYVCADGTCRSLTGEPCGPDNPTGPCADPGQSCDDRTGSATFGTCVWDCSHGHLDGYCAPGLSCYAGWCLEPCASGVVCAFSGVCCSAGQECLDDETCVPACAPPRVRCNQDQVCCPEGEVCWADEFCIPPCQSDRRCGVSGELCCTADEICSPELVCAPDCDPGRALCGVDLDLCCPVGETCLYDQCIAAGASCTDFLDCDYGEYCEPTTESCLPADVPGSEVCLYEQPPQIFNPMTEWRWTGLWPACGPSFECRGGDCAVLCDEDNECQGACIDHRCQCGGPGDCEAGGQDCQEGVCVWSGTACGARYENVMSIPTVADLDHDGYPEVVFRAYTGEVLNQCILLILDGRDGGDGSGPGSPPEAVLSHAIDGAIPWLFASGHQAAANIDDDDELEIIAVAATGLVAFNDPADFTTTDGDGVVLWQNAAYPLDRTLDGGAPTIADLNGDGQVEVLMGAAVLAGNSGAILARPSGAVALDGGGSRFDGGWISIAADVDLDGRPEVITGNRAWNVDEAGGVWSMTPLWESVTAVPRPPDYTETINIPDGFSAVANFYTSASAPDYPEVVNVAGGNLYLFDGGTGTLLAGPILVPAGATGENHGGPPTVADFDGDGRPEVAAAGSGCYAVYDFDCLAGYDPVARQDIANLPGCAVAPDDRCGSYPSMVGVLWNYEAQDFSSACTGSSVFDFDGDGIDEVLYNDECFFRVFDGRDGTVLMERPNSSRTNSEYPIVVDVDGDRNSEILLIANHDQVVRDHCASNHNDDPDYAAYRQYDDLAGAGQYCDLAAFPEHTRECTDGAAGITVFGDTSDRWVKTRPIWHQHAYHQTDVELDPQTWIATVPAGERPSWEDSNTYRKNLRGSIPLNAPDVRVTTVIPDLYTCPTITLNARVANLGALGIDAGLPVSLFGLWEDPPVYLSTTSTTQALLPGAGEYVTFTYTPTETEAHVPLGFRVVADLDGAGETLSECREDNNGAEVGDLQCAAMIPIARCLLASPAADDIGPLESVTFDGSFSYDPEDPGSPDGISSYSWEVVQYPDGAWPGDFDPQGNGTPIYSIWLPIAGTYTVRLTVIDQAGMPSADTAASLCTVEAVPKSWIHVQLVWEHAVNDQDLHVVWWTNPTGNRGLFNEYDCYYADPLPAWFGDFDQDPRLDIDDTYGYGPENFNIDQPAPGTYRVYVNYAGNHYSYFLTPVTADTVRIYIKGELVGEYRRRLSYDNSAEVWAVADIIWNGEDDYHVSPLPSDAPWDPSVVGYICGVYYDYGTGWWATTCPTDP